MRKRWSLGWENWEVGRRMEQWGTELSRGEKGEVLAKIEWWVPTLRLALSMDGIYCR